VRGFGKTIDNFCLAGFCNRKLTKFWAGKAAPVMAFLFIPWYEYLGKIQRILIPDLRVIDFVGQRFPMWNTWDPAARMLSSEH
jgi:hypothetical protein